MYITKWNVWSMYVNAFGNVVLHNGQRTGWLAGMNECILGGHNLISSKCCYHVFYWNLNIDINCKYFEKFPTNKLSNAHKQTQIH